MTWNDLPIVDRSLTARQKLAAIFRIMAHFRFTDLIHTHASARDPDHPGDLLINRYDLMFHEIMASGLVRIDEQGQFAPGQISVPVNAAGCNIHSAVHEARKDIGFVIHTHTRAGAAVSIQKNGLLPISQQALMFHGSVGYHAFEGFVLSLEERLSLVRDMGDNKCLILRNHGLLVVGRTAAEAVNRMWNLERACEIQIAAQAGGGELVEPPLPVQDLIGEQAGAQAQLDIEQMAWEACLRLIANEGEDFRN